MPENFKERRMDPEELLSLDIHAGRALQRKEFQGLGRRVRRRAIGGAVFREGDIFKRKLFDILDSVERVRSPEQRKLLSKLMRQREGAAALWTRKFPLESAPAEDKIMDSAGIFLRGLPNKVLQAFVELCPKSAGLVCIPGGVSVGELLQVIDKNQSVFSGKNIRFNASIDWGRIERDRWGFGITDFAECLPFDSDVYYVDPHFKRGEEGVSRSDRAKVSVYEQRFTEKGVRIMPRHGSLSSIIEMLVEGKVFNGKCFSVFDEPFLEGLPPLPYARCFETAVELCDGFPGNWSTELRCRPWYEEDMIL